MLTRLLAPAILLLLLPSISAAPLPLHPAPDSIGHVKGDGLVSVTYTLNPAVEAGDLVLLCSDAPDVPEDRDVLGAIKDGCFQPSQTEGEDVGHPLPVLGCSPVGGTILDPEFPYVVVNPNEQCIDSIPGRIFGLLNNLPMPTINVEINK